MPSTLFASPCEANLCHASLERPKGHVSNYLWRDKGRPSREVKQVAAKHLADLETRIEEMRTMAGTLRQLVRSCHGDDRADCPILADLGGSS